MATGWYPRALADRLPWHANFAVQAAATGTGLGLSAAQVTQIAVDSANLATIHNWLDQVETFRQSSTEYRNLVFRGTLGSSMPAAPTPPSLGSLSAGSLPAIEARTRQYANLIRASLSYTAGQGERYGIVAPAAAARKTPTLAATALTDSQISLSVRKGGYSVIAIDSRTAGGAWTMIGISMIATYLDARPPVVEGQPEVREYRAQGMLSNARVGTLSPIIRAVTVP